MSGLVRRLFGRTPAQAPTQPSPMDREEKGYPPESEGTSNVIKPPTDRRHTFMSIAPSDLVPTDDRLLVFRTLTGIDTVPAINSNAHSTRSALNIGIYTRVVREERKAKKSYRSISAGIHICLALQIVIGAAITAVAASNGSHRAITGLGAMNTIFAGALAYVKGSGYPESLKHHELEWKKIREYMEQRERELCLAGSALDVYHEVRVIEEMYQRAKKELKLGRAGRDIKEVNRADGGDQGLDTTKRRPSGDLRPSHASVAPTTTTQTAVSQEKRPESQATTAVLDKARDG